MANRREFVIGGAAAGLLVGPSVPVALASALESGVGGEIHNAQRAINALRRRDETTLRLGGVGDNFHMSWAADDRQYVSVCDGVGWLKRPAGMYNSRLFSITGSPESAIFRDVSGYPDLMPTVMENVPRYYNFGTLAVGDRIYQFLSTFNHAPFGADGAPLADLRFVGAKLIYSPDQGRTWCNQDGSSPVVWESWSARSRETMVFFEESQDAFSLLSVLQMGKGYKQNRDGYVYVYSPNGSSDGTMSELVMFRVRPADILDREKYEFFGGVRGDGAPKWEKDIDTRRPVCTFPRGWVNKLMHPYAWHPSLAYNAPLGLYIMANWGMGCTPNGVWFGKPSYLGFWTAPQPWGPWTQIHEETAWTPVNDALSLAYQPQIAPKWIAQDGTHFWLVWTDFQQLETSDCLEVGAKVSRLSAQTSEPEAMSIVSQWRHCAPYYAFNTQRVDLVV